MKAVIQRATRAAVRVDGQTIGEIKQPGLVVLLGITHDDGRDDTAKIVKKLSQLRVLDNPDPDGPEQSVVEAGAPLLVISQFTLYASTKKGRRPSFTHAAPGDIAEPLYNDVVTGLRQLGLHVETGQFGAMMEVELVNNGPYTLIVESRN